VDNGGSTPITYTLSHEPALAQLYSTDVTAQVCARLKIHNVIRAVFHLPSCRDWLL